MQGIKRFPAKKNEGGRYVNVMSTSAPAILRPRPQHQRRETKTPVSRTHPKHTQHPQPASFRFFRDQGRVSKSRALKTRKRPESRLKRHEDRSLPFQISDFNFDYLLYTLSLPQFFEPGFRSFSRGNVLNFATGARARKNRNDGTRGGVWESRDELRDGTSRDS